MGRLIYSAISSLDGYVADEQGRFDWAEPDDELHAFVNDLGRPVGTYLYGRRIYEVMVAWETIADPSGTAPPNLDTIVVRFALAWRGSPSTRRPRPPAGRRACCVTSRTRA